MKLLISFILLSLSVSIASGRLSETRKEIEDRFGDPIEVNETFVSFLISGVIVTLEFDENDTVWLISYRKVDGQFSDGEIEFFLARNAENEVWSKEFRDWATRWYSTPSGKRALLDKSLTFCTVEKARHL